MSSCKKPRTAQIQVKYLEQTVSTAHPYFQACPGAMTFPLSDLRKFHADCCAGWTNDWYEGSPPMLGCQGIYSMPPDKYFEAINSFELIAGDWDRAWARPSARCILTLDGPPPTVLSSTGFTKIPPASIDPSDVTLWVLRPGSGPGIIRAPPCSYNPGYHAMHGICGPVDLDKLEDPSYLSKLWALYQGTFHYEHGAGLKIIVMENTKKSSTGLFLNPPNLAHMEAQFARFSQLRANPARKTPRAWTASVTGILKGWAIYALYMLHGLGHGHVHFGKVVADFGLAGQGGLSNRGKLLDCRRKDRSVITSTRAFKEARKQQDLLDVQPDYLLRSSYKHTAASIIQAMSPEQQEVFKTTLIPMLYLVEKVPPTLFLEENYLSLVDEQYSMLFE